MTFCATGGTVFTRQQSLAQGAAGICRDKPRSGWPLLDLGEAFAARCVQHDWLAFGSLLSEAREVAWQEPAANAQAGMGSATNAAHTPTSDTRRVFIPA
jgi:hypothetical protein